MIRRTVPIVGFQKSREGSANSPDLGSVEDVASVASSGFKYVSVFSLLGLRGVESSIGVGWSRSSPWQS